MKTSYVLKHLAGSLIFFVIIFISAGKVYYWQGLAYVFTGVVMAILGYTILRPDSDLLAERGKSGKGTKSWDKMLLLLSFIVTISMYVIAGLDSGRNHWSPEFHWSLYLAGIIFTATGQFLFLLAQKQNKFFSSMVRIQTDRNHSVCDTGLYNIVRHPAYLGSVIQALGFPLIFGSLWSIIPVAALIILHIVRTCLEDKTLQKELMGYAEYSKNTRYMMIPLVL